MTDLLTTCDHDWQPIVCAALPGYAPQVECATCGRIGWEGKPRADITDARLLAEAAARRLRTREAAREP